MPHLASDSGAMRLALRLVQREGTRPAQAGGPPAGRVLATAAVEWLDARDSEWWPFVRLPPLWIEEGALDALAQGVRELLQGAVPGFSWQGGATLGLPLGRAEGGAGVVELGIDLGPFLADVGGSSAGAGAPRGAGGEAALFRFGATVTELVRFGRDVEAELAELRGEAP